MLDKVRARRTTEPGQVNGDYATWTVGGGRFESFRYRISTRSRTNVSPGDRHGYGVSVARDGTAFVVRSGDACGKNVTVERWRAGNRRRILQPANGIDMFQTGVYQRSGGRKRILHERIKCSNGLQSSDIYRFKNR